MYGYIYYQMKGEEMRNAEEMHQEDEVDRLEMEKMLLGQSLNQLKRRLRDKEI